VCAQQQRRKHTHTPHDKKQRLTPAPAAPAAGVTSNEKVCVLLVSTPPVDRVMLAASSNTCGVRATRRQRARESDFV
jgi:hypothetical protein